MEDFHLSDLDCDTKSDDSVDLYGEDPVFESKEELEKFMESCDLGVRNESEEEEVCYELTEGIENSCTCKMFEDIWSHGYEHLCCHQSEK